jgi:hypothetical protein
MELVHHIRQQRMGVIVEVQGRCLGMEARCQASEVQARLG